MSYVPGTAGSGEPDFGEYYTVVGLPKAGLTSPNFSKLYTPFILGSTADPVQSLEIPKDAGTRNGATVAVAAADGGTYTLATGVAANASALARPNAGAVLTTAINTTKWYLAFRAKFSAIGAIDSVLVYLAGGSPFLGIGLLGSISTANFLLIGTYTGSNTNAVLGAADTNWHTFEMWSDGSGTVYASMDGGASVSFVQNVTGWSTTITLNINTYNGLAGGANRTIALDDLLWICGKAP